jgi:hypothetical protein
MSGMFDRSCQVEAERRILCRAKLAAALTETG